MSSTHNGSQKKVLSAMQVADYFIWKSKKEGKSITNKKLQKLLYYAQAWHLVFFGDPLFKEDIEAWVHGPAIRNVYINYKIFGSQPIEKEVKDDVVVRMKDKKEILNQIWGLYGKLDAEYLEELTHNEAPWLNAREGLDSYEPSTRTITTDEMKKFYTEKLKKLK